MAKFLNNVIISIITTLRPILGPAACKFPVGCTQYAFEQLKEKRLFPALWAILKRLLACNPLYGVLKK